MACACKNKAARNEQATKVKQVVKSAPHASSTTGSTSSTGHRVTKRVIYRRSV